jgi:hypothetical protein
MNSSSWVKTNHWGKKVAVTSRGRCYHFNSENTIWCCKIYAGPDSSGFVTNAPTTPLGSDRTILDIGAGYVSNNTDAIWVVCANGYVYKGLVVNNVFTSWSFMYDVIGAGGVILPGIYGARVQCVAADPNNGNLACVGHFNGGGTPSFPFHWWTQAKLMLINGTTVYPLWNDIVRNDVADAWGGGQCRGLNVYKV